MDNLYILRNSELHGRGVFAAQNIKKGQTIFYYEGDLYDNKDLDGRSDDSYSGQDDRFVQVAESLWLGPYKENRERNQEEGPDDVANHSCNPNCLIASDKDFGLKLKARRDITKGEELTFDYSTNVIFDTWKMKCNCQDINCRKIIGEFRTLPVQLQKQYIGEGGVPGYILKHIKFTDEKPRS